MNQYTAEPRFENRERLGSPILIFLAGLLDPVCKKTFWTTTPLNSAEQKVQTPSGPLRVFSKIEGVGRVADVFAHGSDAIEVTFIHARMSSLLTYRICEHRWLSADANSSISAPMIYAPTTEILNEFVGNSFTILLRPQAFGNQKKAIPKIRRGELLKYSIAATDLDGREGVAIRLEKV